MWRLRIAAASDTARKVPAALFLLLTAAMLFPPAEINVIAAAPSGGAKGRFSFTCREMASAASVCL